MALVFKWFIISTVVPVTVSFFYNELDNRYKNRMDEQYAQGNKNKIFVDNRLKKYQAVKTIVWFNQPSYTVDKVPFGPDFFSMCKVKTCTIQTKTSKSLATSDAVIFHAVNLPDVSPPKRNPRQTWIFFGLEPPFHYKSHVWESPNWSNLFNWTMTYRFDSDVIHPYSISRMRILKLKNYADIIQSKTRLIAWSVSNCNSRGRRMEYVRQLTDYFDVDIYGKCGTFACKANCFEEINKHYKFYLAFENSFCKDYITEKFFRTQNLNVVAIVRGGGDYSKFYPAGTYINTADYSSVRELAGYLQYLDHNDTAYSEYLQKKADFISGDNIRKLAFCEMCRKLHDVEQYGRTISNISDWLNGDSCHAVPDLSAYEVDDLELQRLYLDMVGARKKHKPILQLDL